MRGRNCPGGVRAPAAGTASGMSSAPFLLAESLPSREAGEWACSTARVKLHEIAAMVDEGADTAQIIARFPALSVSDVQALLAFARFHLPD